MVPIIGRMWTRHPSLGTFWDDRVRVCVCVCVCVFSTLCCSNVELALVQNDGHVDMSQLRCVVVVVAVVCLKLDAKLERWPAKHGDEHDDMITYRWHHHIVDIHRLLMLSSIALL